MKLTINLILLTVLNITALHLNAQRQGYLGRPVILNYEFMTVPNLGRTNQNGHIAMYDEGSSSFLHTVNAHKITADFQINPQKTLGVGYGFSNTGVNFGDTEFTKEVMISGNAFDRSEDVTYLGMFQKAGVQTFELRYTRFDNLAPIGSYWLLKGGMHRVSLDGQDVKMEREHTHQAFADAQYEFNPETQSALYIGFEYGKQRIILDRFTFRYGVEFNLGQGLIFSEYSNSRLVDFNNTYNADSESELKEIVESKMQSRASHQFFMMFKIGLGIIGP